MEKELQIFNFENEGKKLFIFKWNDKIATIAPELMAFEGYKDAKSSWRDNKKSQEFDLDIEYHTLKDEELKEFKKIISDSHDLSIVVGTNPTTLYEQYKSVPQLDIVYEEGIYGIMYSSGSNHAIQFKKWLRRDVNKAITATGKFDIVEDKINKIEDEKEKELKLKLYNLETLVKNSPNDLLLTLTYNNAKSELNTYLSDKKLEEVNNKLDGLQEDFNEQSEQLKKTTVLREGDMSAEAIAKKFNIFSINDKPHNRFADYLAKEIGFYMHPEGNSGYQDDFISINLENKFGQTRSVVKYSKKAVEEMEKYIEENGLKFEEPPQYYKRGEKKGKFNYTYLLFENGERIKVNELTYKLYSSEYND